jgi:ornithine decarboxylase
MVEPFYAMKCNPDPVIVRLLATLGCGFDCATMGEIDHVLNKLGDELSFAPHGLAGDKMVYANPAKFENHLNFAA